MLRRYSTYQNSRSILIHCSRLNSTVETKVSGTLVLPGVPVSNTQKTTTPISTTYDEHQERIPSSRFSAFLRGIQSGLPFFPKKKQLPSSVNVATTREHFLPLTRPSLIRLIATDQSLLDEHERLLFHQLCEGFDSAVVQRYHPILNELKTLFHPLNPDQEQINLHHRLSSQERLDHEYWLLQKIDDLLRRSNFTELPRDVLLDKFLIEEDSSSSVTVKIDGHQYDVLKFWILGREQIPMEELTMWQRLFRKKQIRKSNEYFKRLIVAVRLKGQDRLYLKAFRDIPLQNLPQLLPVGKLEMGPSERRLIRYALFAASSTAVTHLITSMADFHLPGLIVAGSSFTLFLSFLAYRGSYRSKIDYLANINRFLFYKNIASNKQLLAMIVDRAEDELSKEILLTYVIALSRRKQNPDLTRKVLELEVENWIRLRINGQITFNSEQSIEFLRKLGVVLPDDSSLPDRIQVIPMLQVVGILPKISRALSEKNEDWDLIEGYDNKNFEVDWKTVLNEDRLLKKSGWH